ncbi:alpha/beta fold hydrolase [Microbacterium trichothecenolyticum]
MTSTAGSAHRAISADGVSIAYRDFRGDDCDTVVLVHGTALSQVPWRGLGYVAALAKHHRVLTLDLRGHGRSVKPSERASYSLTRLAEDVVAVLDHARVPAAHYVGYSLGAVTGFHLLDRHPERIRTFVSIGGTYRLDVRSSAQIFFPRPAGAIEVGGMDAFVETWETHTGRRLDPETSTALRRNDPRAMIALLDALEQERGLQLDRLSELRNRTLLIVGDADIACLAASIEASRTMPNATPLTLPGHDHASVLNAGSEIALALDGFLRGLPLDKSDLGGR